MQSQTTPPTPPGIRPGADDDSRRAKLHALLDPENQLAPWGQYFTPSGEAAHGQTPLDEINSAIEDVQHAIDGTQFEIEEIEHGTADEYFDIGLGTLKQRLLELRLEHARIKNEEWDAVSALWDEVSADKTLADSRREWKLEGGAGEVGDNFQHELGILVFGRLVEALNIPAGQASPQVYWTMRDALEIEGMMAFLGVAEASAAGDAKATDLVEIILRRLAEHSRDEFVESTYLTFHPVRDVEGDRIETLIVKTHAHLRQSAKSDRRTRHADAHRRRRRTPRNRQGRRRAAVRTPGSRRRVATSTSGSDPGGGGDSGDGSGGTGLTGRTATQVGVAP